MRRTKNSHKRRHHPLSVGKGCRNHHPRVGGLPAAAIVGNRGIEGALFNIRLLSGQQAEKPAIN
jgi:hypothetical protein